MSIWRPFLDDSYSGSDENTASGYHSPGKPAKSSEPGTSQDRKRRSNEGPGRRPTDPKVQKIESPEKSHYVGTSTTQCIYVFGGEHEGRGNGHVERYTCNDNRWNMVSRMRCDGVGIRAVKRKDLIWVVGGPSRKNVYTFCPDSFKWEDEKSMKFARRYHCLVLLNGALFAIGGEDSGKIHRSVELHWLRRNEWETRDELLTQRSDFGAAVLDGQIFVAGGKTSAAGARTDTVETYKLGGKWTRAIQRLDIARVGFTLIPSTGSLFAIGGDEDSTISKFQNDRWARVSTMPANRRRQRTFAVNDRGVFYIVGGKRDGHHTGDFDEFTVARGRQPTWYVRESHMFFPRSGAAAVIVFKCRPSKTI